MLRRLLLLLGLAAAVAGAFVYVHHTMPPWYARWWYPLHHQEQLSSSARQYGLDPALVAAVIYEESSFSDDSTSRSGAIGLMQLMPPTARWIAGSMDGSSPTADQIRDPGRNIAYGCWYLRYLLDRYQGSQLLALAAYNAGTDNVDSWIAASGASGSDLDTVLEIPYPETRDYVVDVDNTKEIYKRTYPELGEQG